MNSRTPAATNIAPNVVSVHFAEPLRQKKLLLYYPEVVNYLVKKFANDRAFVKITSAILHYAQPTSMTAMRYVDDLYAKFCKVADVYDDSTLNVILIKGIDFSISRSLRKYCATKPQANSTSIAFKATSLVAIQKESTRHSYTGN